MALSRDDFPKKAIELLAQRAGYVCSKPRCNKKTIGASEGNPKKAASIGVAAHIHAASEGGPRYDVTQTPEQRKDFDNGIWLCSNHAALIDRDPKRYPADRLS